MESHSFFSPTTCFSVACVAFSFIAVTSVWKNSQGAVAEKAIREDRPKPRRRVAVDSLYVNDAYAADGGGTEGALSILADLIALTAKRSANLRKNAGGYVSTALLTELSVITTNLCQLQAAVCNNAAAISPGTGLGACFIASTSSLDATIKLVGGERKSHPSVGREDVHNEALQQLRAQKPALEFLVKSMSKTDGLPLPTPPSEPDQMSLLKPSDAQRYSQTPTGLTPGGESKAWLEPPPEYSPPADSSAISLAQKCTEKSATIGSTQPPPELGTGDANLEALYQAATENDTRLVSDLLAAGLDPSTPFGDLQRTPLHAAVHLNHTTSISILLRHGASTTAEDASGDTPLHLASWAGHCEALSTLLAHGAEIDFLSGRDGYSALWCAISAYHIDAARLLLRNGARVSLRSGSGLVPLHQAAITSQSALCELLLSRGAAVDAADDEANTALHYAATSGSEDCTRLLLRAGADVEARQAQGLTPAHWAAHKGHVGVLAILVEEFGAESGSLAEEGATPLHLAACRGHVAVVRCLLEKGVQRDLVAVWDGVEGTAKQMARHKGHGRVVRMLDV